MGKSLGPDVLGVVVSYNDPVSLEATVCALCKEVGLVYIVDNGSASENRLRLERLKEKYVVDIEYLPVNLGIGAALNLGLKKAKKEGFRWLLTMDQDSVFREGFMDAYSRCVLRTGAAVLAPNINNNSDVGEDGAVSLAITSGNLVHLSVFDRVGSYNEWLFIDGVDFDFSFRVLLSGFNIVLANDAVLEHRLGERDALIFRRVHSFHSPTRRYYIFRNHCYLVRLYGRDFPLKIAKMTLSRGLYFFTMILLGGDRVKSVRYALRGCFDFLKGKKGKME